MESFRATARKSTVPQRTPESIIQEYEMYGRSCGEDLGEFLAHFRVLWSEAHPHGVSHLDGIVRLIGKLPENWKSWAIAISQNYIYPKNPNDHDVNGFLRFLGEIHYCFIVNKKPPQGPYLPPEVPPTLGRATSSRQPNFPPRKISLPKLPFVPEKHTRDKAEPSHVPTDDPLGAMRTTAPKVTLPDNGESDPHMKIARKRYRGDKAPVKEENDTRNYSFRTLKRDAHDSWMTHRFDGMLGRQFLPGECPQKIIYVDSSSEDEYNEESEEDPEEDLNSPFDDDTTSQ